MNNESTIRIQAAIDKKTDAIALPAYTSHEGYPLFKARGNEPI